MPKKLYITIFSFFILNYVFPQNIQEIRAYSDDQFKKGNYRIALKEYHRILFFDSENKNTDLYKKVALIYDLQGNFENAVKYYNLAWNVERNDSSRLELAFLKAMCNFRLNDYFSALNELLDLPEFNSLYFLNKKNLYLGICYYGLNDFLGSINFFSSLLDSTGKVQIQRLFNDFDRFMNRFNPHKIEILSYIFPGSGQIYTGHILSGLNSFLLVGAIFFYSIYTMANYGFIDGLLVLSSWLSRYYTGGAKNAGNFARQKINNRKSDNYRKILRIIEEHRKV